MYGQVNPMWTSLTLLMILPAIISSPRALAATPPSARVAVVNAVDLPPNLVDLRAKLSADLGIAIQQRGFEAIPAPDSCLDQQCLKSLATTSGATDVLVVTGAKNEFLGYRIELRLWNTTTGREERSSPECNTCSASQMIENVIRVAGPLLDRVMQLHTAIAPLPPVVSPPLGTSAPSAVPPENGRSAARLAFGYSLIGVGVIAGASGIALWARHGEPTNCGAGMVCARVYDTRTPGISLTVAGALAAGAGAVVLLMKPQNRSVAISITPSALTIAGTY